MQKDQSQHLEKDISDETYAIKSTILEEYATCKTHFKSLLSLEPKIESGLQIDRDLGRTFPKNPFFKQGEKGFIKLRNVLRAFACYDT